jgi:hypothetical protein
MAKKKLDTVSGYELIQQIKKKKPRKRINDYLEFRDNDVKILIENSGYEMQEIASALGMDRGTLRKKKNGIIQWSPEDLIKLLEFLHFD